MPIIRILLIALACACIDSALLNSSENSTMDCNQDTIPITYQLMDADSFQQIVVGNTIIGTTRQSKSVYLLHFLRAGYCELWKENRIYEGTWWFEKDQHGRDFVRAFWPEYHSSEPGSLFSLDNPRYGNATSIWYYFDKEQLNTLFIATKKCKAPVLIAPGRAFPKLILKNEEAVHSN